MIGVLADSIPDFVCANWTIRYAIIMPGTLSQRMKKGNNSAYLQLKKKFK